MNSFAWLYVLCWCSLIGGFVSSLAVYQPSPNGDATVGSLRREKPLFKTPRVNNLFKKKIESNRYLNIHVHKRENVQNKVKMFNSFDFACRCRLDRLDSVPLSRILGS